MFKHGIIFALNPLNNAQNIKPSTACNRMGLMRVQVFITKHNWHLTSIWCDSATDCQGWGNFLNLFVKHSMIFLSLLVLAAIGTGDQINST